MKTPQKRAEIRIGSILRALCPACHTGRVIRGVFAIRPRCPHCGYNLYPEPGFYLGAMCVGFFLTAALTVPPTIVLKLLNVDLNFVLLFPLLEFVFVGTFLMFYCRILWLHFEYRLTDRLDGANSVESKPPQH